MFMYGGNSCYGSFLGLVYCNMNGCLGKVLFVIFKEVEKIYWVVVYISV